MIISSASFGKIVMKATILLLMLWCPYIFGIVASPDHWYFLPSQTIAIWIPVKWTTVFPFVYLKISMDPMNSSISIYRKNWIKFYLICREGSESVLSSDVNALMLRCGSCMAHVMNLINIFNISYRWNKLS